MGAGFAIDHRAQGLDAIKRLYTFRISQSSRRADYEALPKYPWHCILGPSASASTNVRETLAF
jgi:hypothetical protein